MRHLKTYKIFEDSHEEIMNVHYGADVVVECDSMIDDIKDMLLELGDIGLNPSVGYTAMTLTYREKTPKIVVDVQGDLELCESNEDEINSVFERIKDYTKPKGYVTGFGSWQRDIHGAGGRMFYRTYQMLIQK